MWAALRGNGNTLKQAVETARLLREGLTRVSEPKSTVSVNVQAIKHTTGANKKGSPEAAFQK